jgi:hypothetical protein
MEDLQQQPEADYKINLSNPEVKESEESKEEVVSDSNENKEEVVEEVSQEEVSEEQVQEAQAEEQTEESSSEEPLSKEEMVNKLLSDRFNVTLEQLPEVLSNNEKKEAEPVELPEDVQKYLEYRKETNRSLSDFVKLQQGFNDIPEDTLLKQYYAETKPGLDDSDYEYLLDSNFGYDPQRADEDEIKRKLLNKKEEIYKAKQYFESIKERYKTPLESSAAETPEEYKEAFSFYNQYKKDLAKQEEDAKIQRKSFEEKTNSFFNQNFEGFDFKVGEKNLVYKPKDLQSFKDKNSDINNFFTKHLNSDGSLKDAKAYHTALSMAMNPQSFANFFYEQGKSDAVNEVVKDGKNIDMAMRNNAESTQTRPKFRVVEDNTSFGSGLRIKKR